MHDETSQLYFLHLNGGDNFGRPFTPVRCISVFSFQIRHISSSMCGLYKGHGAHVHAGQDLLSPKKVVEFWSFKARWIKLEGHQRGSDRIKSPPTVYFHFKKKKKIQFISVKIDNVLLQTGFVRTDRTRSKSPNCIYLRRDAKFLKILTIFNSKKTSHALKINIWAVPTVFW